MSEVDWNNLSSKSAQPPFVPDVSAPLANAVRLLTSRVQAKRANFDVTHELDEFLMVEKPLTHSKRKANLNLDKMKPEFRKLEEEYAFIPHA